MAKQRGRVKDRYDVAAVVFGNAYLKTRTPTNIVAGFKKCGISPFNANVVSKELLLPLRSLSTKSEKIKRKIQTKCTSPKPSTSGLCQRNVHKKLQFDNNDDESDLEDEDEKCCICNRFSPLGLKDCNDIVIVKWAEGTKCEHSCHLRFCSTVRMVIRHGDFYCPHCS